MVIIDKIRSHIEKVIRDKDSVRNEAATKDALIKPFFHNILGYDVFNPKEFVPEDGVYHAGVKIGSVDYCIYLENVPAFFIEAKSINTSLDGNAHQLHKYYSSTPAKFAVLTNGIEYRFFADIEKTNIVDVEPFYILNLLEFDNKKLDILEMFHRDSFSAEDISLAATSAKYLQKVKSSLKKELTNPSSEFVKLIISPFYTYNKTPYVIEMFRPHVKTAISDFMQSFDEFTLNPISHGFETAFVEVVRGILTEAGHTSVQFESKVKRELFFVNYKRCRLCLFHYDEHNLSVLKIQFMQQFMESGCDWNNREQLDMYTISSASDVRKYADRIVAAAKDIDEYYRELSHKYKDNKGD